MGGGLAAPAAKDTRRPWGDPLGNGGGEGRGGEALATAPGDLETRNRASGGSNGIPGAIQGTHRGIPMSGPTAKVEERYEGNLAKKRFVDLNCIDLHPPGSNQ